MKPYVCIIHMGWSCFRSREDYFQAIPQTGEKKNIPPIKLPEKEMVFEGNIFNLIGVP